MNWPHIPGEIVGVDSLLVAMIVAIHNSLIDDCSASSTLIPSGK